MFRYKKSIPISYERQRGIYNTSRNYQRLDKRLQDQIWQACVAAGGGYAQAVLEFVTTRAGAESICRRHFLSRSTLTRAVRSYYIICDQAGVGQKAGDGAPLPFGADMGGEDT